MKKLLVTMILSISILCFSALVKAEEYCVEVADTIEISVLQPEEITSTATVSPDGTISFPYIGNVEVKGLTLQQIKKEIEDKLCDGYMNYPLVSVVLKEPHSRRFFVYGDISRPGAYPMDNQTTVLKAISMAGGLGRSTSAIDVKILRPYQDKASSQTIEVDIEKALQGDHQADIMLEPEDTIMVSQGKFYVYGEVNSPGEFLLGKDSTALKAIALANGLTKYGSSSRVKILRPKANGSGYENIKINIKNVMGGGSSQDIPLQSGDTVVVSEGVF